MQIYQTYLHLHLLNISPTCMMHQHTGTLYTLPHHHAFTHSIFEREEGREATFNGSFRSLPDGLIRPLSFKDSNDISSSSLNPAATMSFKLTGTNFGNPACIPGNDRSQYMIRSKKIHSGKMQL